jgi:hypothetical protein
VLDDFWLAVAEILSLGIMKKFTPPFVLGFCLASALFAFFLTPFYGREKAKAARVWAETFTKLQLMKQIPVALGDDYKSSDGYNTFFEVKADAVVVVERNGVKTLRNYRGRR